MIGSIRGAISVDINDNTSINCATKELLQEIIKVNNLDINKVTCMFFSATKDLTAEYPAKAAREMGFTIQSLMCSQEMFVEGSLPMCIRVCIIVNDLEQQKCKHVYLKNAKCLRPDIV